MKKFSYLLLLATVIMSCAKNEVTQEAILPDDNQINFAPVVGKQSKGAELGLPALKTDLTGIKTYGYMTVGNFADATVAPAEHFGVTIKHESPADVWTASSKAYWPTGANEKVSVFSYFPVTIAAGEGSITYTAPAYATALTYPTIDFTVADACDKQKDLVVSNEMNQTKSVGQVAISLKHVLSQVRFKAATTDNSYRVKVKEIKVLQAKNAGKFTFDGAATVGAWSGQSGAQDYTFYTNATGITCGATAKDILTSSTDYCLMLMPQSKNTAFKLSVKYDIETPSGTVLAADVTKSVEMEALAKGKKYIYNLTLPTTAEVAEIEFTVDVVNWDADTKINASFETYKYTSAGALKSHVPASLTAFSTNRPAGVEACIHTIEVTGEITEAITIDLSLMTATTLLNGDYAILDFSGATFSSGSIAVTAGSVWNATASISAPGIITLTPVVVVP